MLVTSTCRLGAAEGAYSPVHNSSCNVEATEDSDDEEEDDETDFTVLGGSKKADLGRKSGRKAKWSEALLNDTVDIIVNNEYFKRTLIFENAKNRRNAEIYMNVLQKLKERAAERNETVPFTDIQLRTGFKRAVSDCKKAAFTMKTSSGIKRFQNEKGFGALFNHLLALLKHETLASQS